MHYAVCVHMYVNSTCVIIICGVCVLAKGQKQAEINSYLWSNVIQSLTHCLLT